MDNCSKIMGIPVPKVTMEETVHIIDQVITDKKADLFHVVTLNPEITMSCQHDLQLRSIIDEAGHLTADGTGIVMVSRLKGNPLPERVTGCDLFINLLEIGNENNWSFYLLGANEITSLKASEEIRKKYPNVSVVGRHHGFFDQKVEAQIVDEIATLSPDVLVVALGAPKAEFWIHKFKNKLNARVAIGVGGSLDVIAGTVKRAPVIWQKLNVEWLYRLINQPSRWRRQLILPRFAMKALFFKENNRLQ
ncbi:WecB/TagA/CpsF family glycosyltransferase [Paenibacillus aceris]|uniref:N-acetylglucosaminyldiphosphoundecaprenol N-acetyl-beta-D-mannosaminyltransferase n=1 Tax=Paenibacillus aceris TaxID=869555 RepID=A0ABS4I095_9BACL|nr:WecB/TagA/CpsF family glycosyltransferase [Paenibacillus aceris]MBP1964223.1 N-acetylglucosaminyldiphosphoundecaprenol N-acetyl-beta-D-mannosaminyltransferase [Paenibacillus aceris]NHW36549.1 WecB/TagA/CpsF family glycosyltransferase [Paenibacillus aceris]